MVAPVPVTAAPQPVWEYVAFVDTGTPPPQAMPAPKPVPSPRQALRVPPPEPTTFPIIRGSSKRPDGVSRKEARRARKDARRDGMVFASASDTDESDDETEDQVTIQFKDEHVHSDECIHNRLEAAEGAEETVEVQVDIIEGQHEKADDMNDELAAIIEKLRQQQGLPREDPYLSPKQEADEGEMAAEESGPFFNPDLLLEFRGPEGFAAEEMAAEGAEEIEEMAAEEIEEIEEKPDMLALDPDAKVEDDDNDL
jgi:hypothetical protein